MWRHVDMLILRDPFEPLDYAKLCRFAVDLSKGGLVSISINHFAVDDLLLCIAERSSQLKHLGLAECYCMSDWALSLVAAKLPLLEELEFSYCKEAIEVFGRRCRLLKTFKLNYSQGYNFKSSRDHEARATAENMPGLVHLHICGNRLTNDGLEAVMDACPYLKSFDLRRVFESQS